jgi:conjugal transfer pilus assembly protein TraU
VQRTAARLHRMGTQWAASGSAGLCGYYPQILMDKNNYKYSMSYPAPQGIGDGVASGDSSATGTVSSNKCCQPFGRTTQLWGAGKEIPYVGEDFGYLIYRKRDCCQSGKF